MPENLKAIRRRIRSVESTKKITQAMRMVAAAKLRRAQERAEGGQPYAEELRHIMANVAGASGVVLNPLFETRAVERVAYIVVTGDRGLSGPFNSGVTRAVGQDMAADEVRAPLMVIVGRKGLDFFRRRHFDIANSFTMIGDDPAYELAATIAQDVIARFVKGEVDEVRLVYSHFVNAMSSRAIVERLIPIVPPEGRAGREVPYLLEPDEDEVLNVLVPQYVASIIFSALLDSKASEQGARMTAMESATKAAGDLITHLVLLRNRARQAAITREIAEIVGGAAALE